MNIEDLFSEFDTGSIDELIKNFDSSVLDELIKFHVESLQWLITHE
jgi:hypothetical protein